MKMNYRAYNGLLMVLALFSALFQPAWADVLRIAAPSLPPMIMLDGAGHEQKIIEGILSQCGFETRFVLFPFAKHWQAYSGPDKGALEAPQVVGTPREVFAFDAVTTVPPDQPLPGYKSVSYINYQNGVTVLEENGPAPESLAEMAGRRVIAFADARNILPDLEKAIPTFLSYQEKADQITHSSLLFAGRVDAVLSDGLILAEFNRRLQTRIASGEQLAFDPSRPVHFRALFPPSPYHMVFRRQEHQQMFDRCYADFKKSGQYDALMREAVSRYRTIVGHHYLGY